MVQKNKELSLWFSLDDIFEEANRRAELLHSFKDESANVLFTYVLTYSGLEVTEDEIEPLMGLFLLRLHIAVSAGLRELEASSVKKTLFAGVKTLLKDDRELRASFTASEAAELINAITAGVEGSLNLLDQTTGLYLLAKTLESLVEAFSMEILMSDLAKERIEKLASENVR